MWTWIHKHSSPTSRHKPYCKKICIAEISFSRFQAAYLYTTNVEVPLYFYLQWKYSFISLLKNLHSASVSRDVLVPNATVFEIDYLSRRLTATYCKRCKYENVLHWNCVFQLSKNMKMTKKLQTASSKFQFWYPNFEQNKVIISF